MRKEKAFRTESFVRVLLDGRVDLSPLEPFPCLSDGRVQQVEDLLCRLRLDDGELFGVDCLRSRELLQGAISWPTPLLARVIRQLGATDASAALSEIAHLALGHRLISNFGSERQLREFENSGKALCSFALTEESPGSDVSRIQSYAEPTPDGFVLSGTKHWVTNALWATHFIVVARTSPPRAANKPRLTAFLIKSQPGIRVSKVDSPVLGGSGVARVVFDKVQLKKSDILGVEGKGFRLVVAGLSEARLLIGAAVLGAAERAFNDTVARVAERRAFGRPVGNFPSVQYRIAAMLSEIVAMESLVHGVAGLGESLSPADPVERGVVRLAVSRGSARVFDAARELHGAAAYSGEMKAARHWADARALTLLDGSDLALESYIVLEGTREVRSRTARLMDAADVLTRVDAAASLFVDRAKSRWRKVGAKRMSGLGLDGLYELAERLGSAVEVIVRRHGVELVEHQHTHSRLASITAELATWSALAARVEHEVALRGEVGSRRMVDAATVWVNRARVRVKSNLEELAENDDLVRDRMAVRAYADRSYPFDIF